jgi:hypothetical protein
LCYVGATEEMIKHGYIAEYYIIEGKDTIFAKAIDLKELLPDGDCFYFIKWNMEEQKWKPIYKYYLNVISKDTYKQVTKEEAMEYVERCKMIKELRK